MTDLALTFGSEGRDFDVIQQDADLATEDGLRSAVLVSLFTDRRAAEDDALPDGTDDRRGSWQDSYLDRQNDRQGSRLWLLKRAKQTAENATRAREYAEEALAWLVEDGVATAVRAQAEWVRRGVLQLTVRITLPDGSPFDDVFTYSTETT
ncbi:hypothetical protein FAZ79_00410 [Guyparkeria sp. SB14A]|uniref:phage GP46 family protein n=1 Tax=Guyparkeria sp. SB14A TaxID=2571147 RepID=UPI0010AC0E84|nr:phage GP46 family protein [Guyparkeria sp. SB14A]TKA91802.1 hypothetical protein FAZ79_00410 [Guyparkeria sp. SB14A]